MSNSPSLARVKSPISRCFMGLGVVPALSLFLLVLGACGGSTTAPPRDAGTDKGTGGTIATGTGGTGGATNPAGTGGTAAGTGGTTNPAGTGGTAAGTGGAAAGTGGAAAGTGGAGSPDAAADVPGSGQPDATFPFDLPIPTDLTVGDGIPAVVPCPTDVITAACTTNTLCLRSGGGGNPEACLCQADHWFCPSFLDAGTGVPTDASFPDVPGVANCATGTTNGGACVAENEVCLGGPALGCLCAPVLGGLRWLCL